MVDISRMIVGVDIAKRVFQLYWVEKDTGRGDERAPQSGEVPEPLRQSRAVFGRDGSVRRLAALGASVAVSMVTRFESCRRRWFEASCAGNKNDAHDARAIWIAVQQPGVRTVAVKTEEQQAVLALHRMRQQLVKFRTAQINGLRGLLAEYGEVMPKGRAGLKRDLPGALGRVSERLPGMATETLREQWARVLQLDEEIARIERRLGFWHRSNDASRRIAEIPGVGVLSATAAVAAMGDPKAFKSGREFAAWLGLVPRHVGTGGRVKMLGISKRGDTYLRTLLIHGARSVLINSKAPPAWARRVAERRPANVATVALANKTARIIWALLAHDRT